MYSLVILIEDPLSKLKQKFEGQNLKFSLKVTNEKIMKKSFKKLKKKNSTGSDGISKAHLKEGSESLLLQLVKIYKVFYRHENIIHKNIPGPSRLVLLLLSYAKNFGIILISSIWLGAMQKSVSF